jgi:ABC-2 type transport system permease protein
VLVIFNLVLTIINYVGFQIADDNQVEFDTFAMISLAPLLLHLTFAAISFAISAFLRKQRLVTSISLAIVLFSYFMSIVSSISDNLSFFKWMTPFEYVSSAYIIEHAAVKPVYLFIMVVVIGGSIMIAIWKYNKKDLIV